MKTEQTTRTPLTVIQGGKISAKEFAELDLKDKLFRLNTLPIASRIQLILEDPDGKRLTQSLSELEYYLLVKGVGENDSLPILAYASPSQWAFTLDMELWDKWEFSAEKTFTWMEHLLACPEEEAIAMLRNLDPELLQLFLLYELQVSGDTGEMSTDSDRLTGWDHTFDNIYFITFRNEQHSRLMGTLLDLLFRLDQPLYLDLMEGCRVALKSEMEELCYQFRNGRLADLGFPGYEQAIEIYSPIKPSHYKPQEPKIATGGSDARELAIHFPPDQESLLTRCLENTGSLSLEQEMGSLVNAAVVAGQNALPDEDSIGSILTRVHGRLNIALEYLSGNTIERAIGIIETERLKRLFQLGCGILQELAAEARTVESSDYATGKALRGFSAQYPMFYRGLDPDHSDGFREFGTMDDIRIARGFLAMLKGETSPR